MQRLNLACGSVVHPGWTNVDWRSSDGSVIQCDLRERLPFSDDSASAIYTSHFLEHLTKRDAQAFMKEVYRVLCPGGVFRAVVPDLEEIVLSYLGALEQIRTGDGSKTLCWIKNWYVLELIDQFGRDQPGGEMLRVLKGLTPGESEFLDQRLGATYHQIAGDSLDETAEPLAKMPRWLRILSNICKRPKCIKELVIKHILGPEYELLLMGRFRQQSGEIHKWMYDDISLRVLFAETGLRGIVRRSPMDSSITEWSEICLDCDEAGRIRNKHSLIMEATK